MRPALLFGVLAACDLLAACDASTSMTEQELSDAVKRERLTLIRDSAAEMGLYNAALLAGVAQSETGLAHCASEASFACPGPASPSCGGMPVIAGGADGPCSAMQGGLGMFQFDAGTYAETVATYGDSILTIEGNTAQAVAFTVSKVELDIPNIDDWRAATAWMNTVVLEAGSPTADQWGKLMACRYNGCCTTSTTCVTRGNGYRDNAIMMFADMGADFWRTADRCTALPDDGVIDQRTACYTAGGEPRYWRREAGGYNDNHEWTNSTAAAKPENFALWKIAAAGMLHLEVHIQGGAATTAKYAVVHAGATDIVTLDQSTADGWVPLGDFDFDGASDEFVMLGDNTGTRDQKLVFDALRATSLDDDTGGCCNTTTNAPTSLFSLGVLALLLRRRRRRLTLRLRRRRLLGPPRSTPQI